MFTSDGAIFADTDPNAWYQDYLVTAMFYGFIIVEDYGTTFKPNEPITRREVAKITINALIENIDKFNYKTPYADVDDKYITVLYGICLMQGEIDPYTGLRNFKPDTQITRCEVSAVITRILEFGAKGEAFIAEFVKNNPSYQPLQALYAPTKTNTFYNDIKFIKISQIKAGIKIIIQEEKIQKILKNHNN
jgi:hypothetical protein